MKKLVLASVMALAGISLAVAPMLRAQDSITIKDPAEFNAYQSASTQSNPQAKAAALENFLTTYPQSVVKDAALDLLVDAYFLPPQQGGLGDSDKALSAAGRLLQVDPNNMKAIYYSVLIKKGQCAKTSDAQTCDDAAALARKGLLAVKPAATPDSDWKNLIGGTYPIFHSAIAFDDAASKKDFKGAAAEYTAELMLYTDDQSKTVGLQDTLFLAQAYAQPGARDLVKSIWFYARAWDFAPASYKAGIEKSLEYYYNKYHGDLKGLDDIKAKAALTTFPGGDVVITQAKTPAEQIHDIILATSDLKTLNLGDKEFILAAGTKEDADKLWAILKDQETVVPGVVIEASATVVKVAVTQDAKDAKIPDFIVNLKKPLADKEIPSAGFTFGVPPAAALVGTYDSFTQIPATATAPQSAQIVLRGGEIEAAIKKPAAPAHKPAAGHKAAK
jgi:hypothetical protein